MTHTKKNYIYRWHEGGGSIKHKGREQQKLHKAWAGPAAGYTHKEPEASEMVPGVQKTPLKNLKLSFGQSWSREIWNTSASVWLSGYLITKALRSKCHQSSSFRSLHNCVHLSGQIHLQFPLQAACTTGTEQKDVLLVIFLALLASLRLTTTSCNHTSKDR